MRTVPEPTGIRIAMWSGPRNISTALMRSWGNRADTFVCDEPFYAHYLEVEEVQHPGREEVLAAHERDWRKVISWLTGEIPNGKRVFYQKHMAHHLLPDMDRTWLSSVVNAFLIRDPREMMTSLVKVMPNARLQDTGLPQQFEIFKYVQQHTGKVPPVIDARDVLQNPRAVLGRLCDAVGLRFDDAMLRWRRGRRDTDGVWAKYWYGSVEKSTGFGPYQPKPDRVAEDLQPTLEACGTYYAALYKHRLLA